MRTYPLQTVGLTLPQASVIPASLPWEAQIFGPDLEMFGGWLADGYDAGTGVLSEHRWQERTDAPRLWAQATEAARPTLNANLLGTGRPALHFDGANDVLDSQFEWAAMTKTVVCAFSLDAGHGGTQALVSGIDLSSNSELYAIYQRRPRVSFNAHNPQGGIGVVDATLHLFIGGMDWRNQVYFMSLDGGPFTTSDISALASKHLYVPGTRYARLGAFNSNNSFMGAHHQAAQLVFGQSLYDPTNESKLEMVLAWMNARYGKTWGL